MGPKPKNNCPMTLYWGPVGLTREFALCLCEPRGTLKTALLCLRCFACFASLRFACLLACLLALLALLCCVLLCLLCFALLCLLACFALLCFVRFACIASLCLSALLAFPGELFLRRNYFPALPNVPDPENNKLRFYISHKTLTLLLAFVLSLGPVRIIFNQHECVLETDKLRCVYALRRYMRRCIKLNMSSTLGPVGTLFNYENQYF